MLNKKTIRNGYFLGNLVAFEYHYTKYQVDSKSPNCMNDFNHSVIIIHLVSAKFQKSRGFITFHPNIMEKGIYKE